MEISRVSRIKPKAVSVARWDVEETVLSLDRWRVTRLLSKKITSKKWRLIFFKSFFWWRMCLSYCHPLQSEKTTKQQPSALFLFFSKSEPKIAFSPSTIRVEYFFFHFHFSGRQKSQRSISCHSCPLRVVVIWPKFESVFEIFLSFLFWKKDTKGVCSYFVSEWMNWDKVSRCVSDYCIQSFESSPKKK